MPRPTESVIVHATCARAEARRLLAMSKSKRRCNKPELARRALELVQLAQLLESNDERMRKWTRKLREGVRSLHHSDRWRAGSAMDTGTWGGEPTLDELLNDPMMLLVFDRNGLAMDDLRTMMRELAARLVRASASEDESVRE